MKAPYIRTLIMAVLALTVSSVAKAQKTSDIINSGDDFLAVCQYENNRPPDVCLAYVAGVAGTLALNWSDTGQRICVPDNATLRTTLDLVLQYIRDNPEKRNQKTIFLVAQVTIKKYVCEAPKQQGGSASAPDPKVRP
ncbi:MAG TPA: Rap1a/Tai family immunity protein [Candidatus Acidoferrales bacterium]|nr:Rap1a/Tai family immunity protein [Candidatus Acidoferrales bacterium]